MKFTHILGLITIIALSIPTQALELIKDPTFKKGFNVKNRFDGGQFLGPLQTNEMQGDPVWSLAEWHSQSTVFGYQGKWIDGNSYRWADKYKAITIFPDNNENSNLDLDINANNEYGGVYRAAGDPWPHLLVSQTIYHNGSQSIEAVDELRLTFEAKLAFSNRNIKSGHNENIHAGQYVMFFTIQNRNIDNTGYGDFLWFGVPIYDDRHSMLPKMIKVDTGSESKPGTGKLMYRISSEDISNSTMHSGEWVSFDADILPHVRDALQEAWSQGFLTDSMDYEDYFIGAMNAGYEVSGLNVINIQLKNLSLQEYSPNYPKNYEFNEDKNTEGWIAQKLDTQYGGPKSGRWYFISNDNDPKIISPSLDINANNVKLIRIRVANDGNDLSASKMQLFWRRSDETYFSGSKSKTISINNTGGWIEYSFDLSTHSEWKDSITKLRIDPVRYGNGSWVGIDYVRFSQ